MQSASAGYIQQLLLKNGLLNLNAQREANEE
jgi:hypothetical protein